MNDDVVKNKKMSVVNETNLGMYVWKMPDGRLVGDDDGNVMNVVAMRGDLTALKNITEAAKYWGAGDGAPYFLEGARRVNEEEREEQLERLKDGKVPDALDIGNYKDMQRGFYEK